MNADLKRAGERPATMSRRGNFWVRFILSAVAVAFVWYFFVQPNSVELTWSEQEQLLGLAREQLAASVVHEGLIDIYPPVLSENLLRDGAAFVSLTIDGQLRGCMIDQFEPHEPLIVNVLRNTELAARADDRFPALTAEEIQRVRIEISIVYDITSLSYTTADDLLEKLTPEEDGVTLEINGEIATYLPSVWQIFPEPAEFLSQLCVKAGWDANCWRTEPYPTAQTYHVFDFREAE